MSPGLECLIYGDNTVWIGCPYMTDLSRDPEILRSCRPLAVYVYGSTKTSTIPGISLAGRDPWATLYTPALDIEYLYYGETRTLRAVPTTPDGVPTPAIVTRAALRLSGAPFIAVESGSYVSSRAPHIKIPSAVPGGRIDVGDALPPGTSRRVFEEALEVGRLLGRLSDLVLIGETIPGGTTTAMAVLVALGHNAWDVVSSSARENPIELKKRVVSRALERLSYRGGSRDVFTVNDVVGDPVHVAIAGLAGGVLERGSRAVLAGGTQMLAVLAIMREVFEKSLLERLVVATTRWLVRDRGREMLETIRGMGLGVPVVYADIVFSGTGARGLEKYEEGYVKEGVGMGGTVLLAMARGAGPGDIVREAVSEYRRAVGLGESSL